MMQQLSAKQQPSATGEKQQKVRTSTTVFAPPAEVGWLRERIARLANVPETHLEPTKLTHYAKGELCAAAQAHSRHAMPSRPTPRRGIYGAASNRISTRASKSRRTRGRTSA